MKKYIANIKYEAKRRNIQYGVDLEYLTNLFNKQNGKCALSGLPLNFIDKKNSIFECTASLDRISSNRGYVKGNVQWVHKHVNYMKHELEQKYFVKICGLIFKNSKK